MKAQPRKLYHLTTLILLLLTPSLFSQEYFNLDFESTIPSTNLPVGWSLSGSSYKISRDTIIKYKGFSSLSFDCFYCDKTDFGMSMSNINWSTNKKKTIKLKGKIKTDSLKNGYAGLWMRADGVSSTLGFENMSNRGFSGTNEWKEAEL